MARRAGRAEQFFRAVIGEPHSGEFETPGRGHRLSDGLGPWVGKPVDIELDRAGRRGRRDAVDPDGAAAAEAEAEATDAGTEAVAVYAPYTFWGRKWGIYIFDDALYRLSAWLAAYDPALRRSEVARQRASLGRR